MNWTLGYNFYSTNAILFNAADIKEPEIAAIIKSGPFQIYMITKRKRVFFEKCIQNADANTSYFYMLDEKHNKQVIERVHEKEIVLKESDRVGFTTIVVNGEETDYRNYDLVSRVFSYRDNTDDKSVEGNLVNAIWPSDLEVMYVGQSFGNMQSRLEKHEKIKDIALKIIDESSTEEVLVFCFAFDTNDHAISFITPITDVRVSVESIADLQKSATKRVSKQQQVTLFEASLIKYFQPEYNKEYKETFPGLGYISYDEIFSTDFDYVGMTLVVSSEFPSSADVRLWSQHVQQPAFVHSDHFPLETQEQKKSLFEYLYDQSHPF